MEVSSGRTQGTRPVSVKPPSSLDGAEASTASSHRRSSSQKASSSLARLKTDLFDRMKRGSGKPIEQDLLDSASISLSPETQSKVYAHLEYVATAIVCRFLSQQQDLLKISVLRREVEAWEGGSWLLFDGRDAKRAKVVSFMFPLTVQARLLEANVDRFLKAKVFTKELPIARQATQTLRGWTRVAESMGVRSLCNPDWLVMEHVRGCEKLFRLLGEGYFDSETEKPWVEWKRGVFSSLVEQEVVHASLPLSVNTESSLVVQSASAEAAETQTYPAGKKHAGVDRCYMDGW